MTMTELLRVASNGYPDGLLLQYWNEKTEKAVDTGAGDTLALFITRELADIYDVDKSTPEQLRMATRALEAAAAQMEDVAEMLHRYRRSQERPEKENSRYEKT